jgi:hypothetical protein
MTHLKPIKILLLLGAILFVTSAIAEEKFPETTKDGLKLQDHSSHGAIYVKEGASLAGYTKINILDCFVQFEKNWQRNYNRGEIGLDHQITDGDVKRIKQEVADAFPRAFKKELEKGGYEIVNETGVGILLLRPAIINLTVTSPKTNAAGWTTSVVRSNGTMTLYLEIYDSASNNKIAEVIDGEAVGNDSYARRGGVVSNNAEFTRTMEVWANTLRNRLDEANGKSSG